MGVEEEREVHEEQDRKEIENSLRIHKALQYTDVLQFPTDTVVRVLLQLVEAYDGKWEFIEADNYRLLVDTFLHMQESRGPWSSNASGSRTKQKNSNKKSIKRRLKKQAESEDSDENDGSHQLGRRLQARDPIASRAKGKGNSVMDEEDEEYYPTSQPQPLLTLPSPQGSGPPAQHAMACLNPEPLLAIEAPVEAPDASIEPRLGGIVNPTAHLGPGVATRSTSSRVVKDKQTLFGRTVSSNLTKRRSLRSLVKVKDEEQCVPSIPVPLQRSRHNAQDISRGKEKVPITLARDESGAKDLPADFYYITTSVVYKSARVGILVAKITDDDRCNGCIGNCLENELPCECSRLTNGQYAYTLEGCLDPHYLKKDYTTSLLYCQHGSCPMEENTKENCKGHIQRHFIKECWDKCGCTQSCGNRVVQRGIAKRLQVFWTGSAKGWGVRTLDPLSAGTFVCEYIGEILSNTEMWDRNNNEHDKETHFFSLQLDADWCSERLLNDNEALCVDATKFGNVARFMNHRCTDGNLIDIPVEIESPDHRYYHLALFTSKDVKEYEELTWDYGLDFGDKDHQVQAFKCACGSSFCRGKLEEEP